ncbi:hypothetical protein SLS56_012120 [Neofusicoccum ribis]|uniref:Uncharacterized protein n=1 Tax=Neofusicoccum ribis TaxID=45134 RepID=A0ABR3SAC1_9PEZI
MPTLSASAHNHGSNHRGAQLERFIRTPYKLPGSSPAISSAHGDTCPARQNAPFSPARRIPEISSVRSFDEAGARETQRAHEVARLAHAGLVGHVGLPDVEDQVLEGGAVQAECGAQRVEAQVGVAAVPAQRGGGEGGAGSAQAQYVGAPDVGAEE